MNMKNFILTIAFTFAFIFSITAQTGNGITTQTSSPYALTPTSVDSTTTVSIQFHNTVAATQTVSFLGLTAPFSISSNSITIPANDSVSVDVSFNPTTVGLYSDTLDWTGSIFGSGSLVLEGEGVQVVLVSSSDTIDMGSLSLGASVSQDITLSNNGTGTMSISNITSNNAAVTLSQTAFPLQISQGNSTIISVTYSPQNSGALNALLQIYSNDPATPVYNITVLGSAVSQISGNICSDLWTPSNNPYVFTDNVYLPGGCQLEIQPGTVVDMNGYQLKVEGSLLAEGNASDSIFFKNANFIFRSEDSLNIKFWDVDFPLQSAFTLYHNDFEDNSDIVDSELPCYGYNNTFDITTYPNNFDFNLGNNYGCEDYTIQTNSYFSYDNSHSLEWSGYTNTSSNYTRDGVLSLKPIVATENGNYRIMYTYKVQSHYYLNTYQECDGNMISYYKINSGNWVKFYEGPYALYNTAHYEFPISDLINLNQGDTINVILHWDNGDNMYHEHKYIDELRIEKVAGEDLFVYEESFEDSLYIEDYWYTSNDANNQISLNTTYSTQGSSSLKFELNGTTPEIRSNEFTIPSDGMYYIQYDMKVVKDKRYNYKKFSVYKDNALQNYFYYYERHSPSNTYGTPYDWREHSAVLGNFVAGDKIQLNFYAYNNNNSSSSTGFNCEFYIDNIKIYNRSESSPSLIAQNSYVSIENSNIDLKINQLGNDLGVDVSNSNVRSISTTGNYSTVALFNSSILEAVASGISTSGNNSEVNLQYSFVKDNEGIGIETSGNASHVNLSSSMVTNNGSYGISSSGQVNSSYSNITFNNDDGINLTGNNFSNIKNSIIWGNDVVNYTQINTGSGVTSITFSTVQGSGAYGTEGGQYYFGDGSIDDDPVFSDPQQHMSSFSNCVDAGTPWEVDANMPYGLGGVRADIGIYGGPDNWFWGGTPVPDGSPVITSIEDSPQDQGSIAGVLFDASVWDNSALINNVTHYAIWRNYDILGTTIDSVEQGNWQLMGDIPAQSFNAYAFEAATLGDSSVTNGMFNNCYVVVAHTGDSATFWYSNVLCGYSVDNLAPAAPIASAIAAPNAADNVIIYWDAPAVPDYASSSVFSNNGFISMGVIDTMTLDVSTLAGGTYTYGVVHYDVNGNASDTAWVTITLDNNEDVIPLTAGWNLISTKQSPSNNTIQDIFSTLMPGNLIYVTGFNQGSLLYNPNGLPFLNTLNQFTDGYGYWVKVLVDDTLRVMGTNIDPLYKIDLMPGWNLSGYMNTQSEAPINYLEDLIISNNLEYCTGFNQGTQLFNPNGLPFLNTLTSMQRPFGYWIKVTNAVSTGQYRLENQQGNKFTPNFMFINGTSNLESHVGGYVEVLNSGDELVAKLTILEGGYLMTTALYGDDPHTQILEGLEDSEQLTFSFNGEKIYSDIKFEGNMELKEINLDFTNDGIWSIYPNPLTITTTINYELSATSHVSIKVFDVTGREIDQIVNGIQDPSNYTEIWNASKFEKGLYTIELYINGVKSITDRVVVQ